MHVHVAVDAVMLRTAMLYTAFEYMPCGVLKQLQLTSQYLAITTGAIRFTY